MDIWGKSIPGKGNKCKVPEAGLCLLVHEQLGD